MKSGLSLWLFATVLSLAAGGAVGFVLMWVWYFIGVFFLGHGDSGPSWVNVVNDIVFIVGLVVCLVGGQWIYFRKMRQQGGLPMTAPPR